MKNSKKYHYKIFFAVLIVFVLLVILANWNFGNHKKIIWGATFSKKQTEELGLDWVTSYGAVISEMNFKVIRLPIYWPDVEKTPGEFDFSAYEWMVEKAAEKGVEVVPVLGRRVPRWPECHVPEFYKNLPEGKLQEKIKILIQKEIDFFKRFANIKKWQIDNEPLADFFGQCPLSDKDLIKLEIDLVRSLDLRPVVITESGELSTWVRGAKQADILGVSIYRQTWNKRWGWFNYPLPPAYYYLKAQLVKILTGVPKVIDTELQVEPWARNRSGADSNLDLKNMDLFDQFYVMDLNQVKNNINFAKKAGFSENYLWGIEWWWWLGIKHGHWEFWEYGKTI